MTSISARQPSRINPYNLSNGYDGHFAASLSTVEIESELVQSVTVESGFLDMGSGNVAISKEEDFPIDVDNNGLLYVYFQAYSEVLFGGETVVYEYLSSLTRPKIELEDFDGEERWTFPTIIAEVIISGNLPTALKQIQYGDSKTYGCLS